MYPDDTGCRLVFIAPAEQREQLLDILVMHAIDLMPDSVLGHVTDAALRAHMDEALVPFTI